MADETKNLRVRNFTDNEFSEFLRKHDRHWVYNKMPTCQPSTVFNTRDGKFLALVIYDNQKPDRTILTF